MDSAFAEAERPDPQVDDIDRGETREFLLNLFAYASPGAWVTVAGNVQDQDTLEWDLDPSSGAWRFYPDLAVATVADVADLVDEVAGETNRWVCIHPRKTRIRGDAKNTSEVIACGFDFDFADSSPAKQPDTSFENIDHVEQFLGRWFPLPPTVIVSSGHGAQPLWILDEPLPPPRGLQWTKLMNDRLQRAAKVEGLEIDAVFDLVRVLRIPGTWNAKPHLDTPAPVRIWSAAWR